MKLKSLLVIILSVAMLGLADNAEAQRKNKYKKRRQTNRKVSHYKGGVRGYGRFEPYLFVGANVNAGNYFGDLAPVNKAASTDISFTRPGFGLYAGYKFHHSVAVTAGLNWVRVFGDDFASDPNGENSFARYARNLSFRNDIKEFRLAAQIFLLPNYGGPGQRLPFNAYLSVGVAVFHHDPQGKVPDADYQSAQDGSVAAPQAGEWVKLRPLGTEGQNLGIVEPYKSIELAIPVAIGAQMRIPNTQLTAGLEFGIRYMFTDYIDDVSTNYVGLEQFSDPLARIMSDRSTVPASSKGEARDLSTLRIINTTALHNYYIEGTLGSGVDGSIRGNPDDNDMVFITQIKVSYVLGGTTRNGLNTVKILRKYFSIFLLLFGTSVSAQFIEFGGGVGTMNYSGDLVRGFSLSTTSLAGTGFYRMNFSEILTVKLALTVGKVKGSETPIDAFATQRNHSFNSTILEVSSVFEYHFLNFKTEDAEVNYSPYIFGGIGFINFNDVPANEDVGKIQPVIPLGVGFKYLFQKKYTLGLEVGARKTFFDYLDGIADGDQGIKDYQYGNPKDNDWYFFTGLTFSITLFNVPCPFPYRPNQSILSR